MRGRKRRMLGAVTGGITRWGVGMLGPGEGAGESLLGLEQEWQDMGPGSLIILCVLEVGRRVHRRVTTRMLRRLR